MSLDLKRKGNVICARKNETRILISLVYLKAVVDYASLHLENTDDVS